MLMDIFIFDDTCIKKIICINNFGQNINTIFCYVTFIFFKLPHIDGRHRVHWSPVNGILFYKSTLFFTIFFFFYIVNPSLSYRIHSKDFQWDSDPVIVQDILKRTDYCPENIFWPCVLRVIILLKRPSMWHIFFGVGQHSIL